MKTISDQAARVAILVLHVRRADLHVFLAKALAAGDAGAEYVAIWAARIVEVENAMKELSA